MTGLLFCLACAFVWYTAYLLGRRDEAQPFKYAFGGEPEPRDYGRTLADGALLILLACFGLAERGHETTPQLAQFVGIAMLVYGLVRRIDKPIQGALIWGAAIGVVGLSSSPVLVCALLLCTLAMTIIVREVRPFRSCSWSAAGRGRADRRVGAADRCTSIPTTANGGCANGGATVSTRSPGRPVRSARLRAEEPAALHVAGVAARDLDVRELGGTAALAARRGAAVGDRAAARARRPAEPSVEPSLHAAAAAARRCSPRSRCPRSSAARSTRSTGSRC